MNVRRRKVGKKHFSEESFSDTEIDYTIDEDFEGQVISRPRLDRSPISFTSPIAHRTRSRIELFPTEEESESEVESDSDSEMAPPTENDGAVGGNNEGNLGGLEAMLERVLTVNHTSFLGELNDFKIAVVETLNRSNNTNNDDNISRISQNSPNETERGVRTTPALRTDLSNTPTGSFSIKMDKWNISYDGSTDIEDFLFKVETLRKRHNYTENQVVANFHVFLKGKAEEWLWFYLKKFPNTNYVTLKEAIVKEFSKVENDCDKIVQMVERRQMPRESFDEYFTDLVTMNSRLSQPMTDQKMIELIKNNSKESLGSLLFSYDLFSLDHLRDAARKAEKYLGRQYQLRQQKRFVSEIESCSEQENEVDSELDVSAINFRNNYPNRKPIDTSKFKCWNCDQLGHSFYDCPSQKRILHCYRCGEKNVTTIECRNHSGNSPRNEKV